MSPSELKSLLATHGARPKKSHGQHFLLDERIIARTIAASGVTAGEAVLEIGPGPGALTEALLAAGARVVAVELDPVMVAILDDRFRGIDALRVVHDDILRVDIAALIGGAHAPYRIVANIPYQITSPILERFLGTAPAPASLTLMVQKEVAERIMAKPGDMSSLAVFVQSLARVERVVNVPRGAFLPPPKVESAVIHITPRRPADAAAFFGGVEPEAVFVLSRRAFQGKRKQLKTSLKGIIDRPAELEKALISAKIGPTQRPEELSPEAWVRLARALKDIP